MFCTTHLNFVFMVLLKFNSRIGCTLRCSCSYFPFRLPYWEGQTLSWSNIKCLHCRRFLSTAKTELIISILLTNDHFVGLNCKFSLTLSTYSSERVISLKIIYIFFTKPTPCISFFSSLYNKLSLLCNILNSSLC